MANLSAADKPVDINDLPERSGIASARGPFDHLTLIESGLLTHEESERLRPRVYEELRRGAADDEYDALQEAQPVRFVKCHDAYTYTANDDPLLSGAIVIVRDPRDVAPSLANHSRLNIDQAIGRMNDSDFAFCGRLDEQANQLRQQLLGWSGHAESRLTQTDIPVHLIQYEHMKADAASILRRALAFAGREVREADIARAVAFADFSELKRQETEIGFRETPPRIAKGFLSPPRSRRLA